MREQLASLASVSSDEPPDAQESDPTRRYWRFDKILGRGAFKTVYKAFDVREGIEVAWNKVALGGAVQENDHRERLFAEISVLKRLKHKNIMTFYDYWLDEKNNTLNFITELFTDGSLRKFRLKHKHLELNVVKKWAWQILQGLVYLHGHEPPIIHRDLKCDNIFINGVSGVLKIGDLGLATLWKGLTAPHSVLGTPEFMAPEYYNEKYDEKVDVYAFGMLLVELVTMEYPYCECSNAAAIYKKVSQGIYPASLQKVRTQELRDFIELCIQHEPETRMAARKLLKHPFFDGIRAQMDPRRLKPGDPLAGSIGSSNSTDGDCLSCRGSVQKVERTMSSDSYRQRSAKESELSSQAVVGNLQGSMSERQPESSRETPMQPSRSAPNPSPFMMKTDKEGQNFSIQCSKADGNNLFFSLRFQDQDGKKIIQFPFNLNDDTADQIVAEMLEEHSRMNLCITDEEADLIGHMIGEEVERSRNEGSEELTAYVNVQRAMGEAAEPTNPAEIHDASPDNGGVMETIVEDIMGDLATNPTNEDELVRTLSERTGDILDVVMSKGDGVLGNCLPARCAPLMPVIHEDGQSEILGQLRSVSQGSASHLTEEANEPVGDNNTSSHNMPSSPAVDIQIPYRSGNLAGSPADVRPIITMYNSPPCTSHFRSLSDKGGLSRWHRAKSEPLEPPDDLSPRVDRVPSRRVSGRPFSDGSVGVKASFRKEFFRQDEEEPDSSVQDKVETGGSGRFSPRSDGQFATSVSLWLLQQKGRIQDSQDHNAKGVMEEAAPPNTEVLARNPMTAISMVLLKPPVANGGLTSINASQKVEKHSEDNLFPASGTGTGIEGKAANLELQQGASNPVVSSTPVPHLPSPDSHVGSPFLKHNHQAMESKAETQGIGNDLPVEQKAIEQNLPRLGSTPGTVTSVPYCQEVPVLGAPNPPLSIGMLERPATPPLIGVGQAHLFDPSTAPVSWASAVVPNFHGIEQQCLVEPAMQGSGIPAQVSAGFSVLSVGANNRTDGIMSTSRTTPVPWTKSSSVLNTMDTTGFTSTDRGIPAAMKSLSLSNSLPLFNTAHTDSLFKGAFADGGFPLKVSTCISPPPVYNGSLSIGTGGGHTRSSSGHSLHDFTGNKHNFAGLTRVASAGDGEGASALIGSSRSSSPSGDASPPALSASGDTSHRASQKVVDKELRQKQAARKMKEMEEQQLEVLSLGYGHGRSMTRSKPLRPTMNS